MADPDKPGDDPPLSMQEVWGSVSKRRPADTDEVPVPQPAPAPPPRPVVAAPRVPTPAPTPAPMPAQPLPPAIMDLELEPLPLPTPAPAPAPTPKPAAPPAAPPAPAPAGPGSDGGFGSLPNTSSNIFASEEPFVPRPTMARMTRAEKPEPTNVRNAAPTSREKPEPTNIRNAAPTSREKPEPTNIRNAAPTSREKPEPTGVREKPEPTNIRRAGLTVTPPPPPPPSPDPLAPRPSFGKGLSVTPPLAEPPKKSLLPEPARESSRPIARPAVDLDPPVEPSRPVPRPAANLDPPMEPSRPVPRPGADFDPVLPPQQQQRTRPPSRVDAPVAPAAAETAAAPAAPPLLQRLLAARGAVAVVAVIAVVVAAVSFLGDDELDAEERAAISALWRDRLTAEQLVEDSVVVDAIAVVRDSVGGSRFRGPPANRLRVTRLPGPRVFALADGTLVVTVDLLALLQSEAELAAVLAHAQAHHDLGHIQRGLAARADQRSAIRAGLDGGPVDAALAAAAVGDTDSYSAEDEVAADLAAIQSLKVGAWDARALRTALDAIVKSEQATAWLARHPVDATRKASWGPEERGRTTDGLNNENGRVNAPEYETRVLERLFPQRRRSRATAKPAVVVPAAELKPWGNRTYTPAPG